MTKLTIEAFASAARKVEWAKQHIANMESTLRTAQKLSADAFSAKNSPDPNGTMVFSIDFGSFLRYMPALQMMAGDAVHNLRTALDHLAYATVSAFDNPSPNLYFPIDVDVQSLVGKRNFTEIKRVAPDIADLIVNEIKPYGAGNPFVTLNQLDRADKHRFLLVHTINAETRIYATKDDDDVPEIAANCFVIVAPGRVPNAGSKAAIHNESYASTAFDIRFDPGLPCENEPVIPTLHQFSQLIAGVVETFKAHIERGSVH